MFKVDWEKTSVTYQLPEGMVEKMVRHAYPDKKLTAATFIVLKASSAGLIIIPPPMPQIEPMVQAPRLTRKSRRYKRDYS